MLDLINPPPFFSFDQLSSVMIGVISLVGASIAFFSKRYLKGDTRYHHFYIYLSFLVIALLIMVSADHITIFLSAWIVSNLLLTILMIHKASWVAAFESGKLAAKNFIFGFVMICSALILFYGYSGHTSIHQIIQFDYPIEIRNIGISLLFLGVMTQSGLWPFHKWLISSLNSPTPVSAIMHAGLVNGGGFLLCRFAPLYFDQPIMLHVIFIFGLITVLKGTLWKLMQSDIKRMLACSTMEQMGFMVVQCGLGLFPAALAHLCWHGMFKAYLFLASGSAGQEKKIDLEYPPTPLVFVLSGICGIIGSLCFAATSHKMFFATDTNLVLNVIAMISAWQLAIPILKQGPLLRFPLALIATAAAGALYGFSVHLIESCVEPLGLLHNQPLTILHGLGLTLLIVAWVYILFSKNSNKQTPDNTESKWFLRLYVAQLNASQPHQKTITTHRNHYHYG